MSSIDEVSRLIGSLQEGVKSLGRSVDQMREDSERDFRDLRQRFEELRTDYDERAGSRRTLALMWGTLGGAAVSLAGLMATKLGLK